MWLIFLTKLFIVFIMAQNKNLIISVGIVVIIALVVIGIFVYQGNSSKSASQDTTQTVVDQAAQEGASQYKDGTYDVVGEYISPGGQTEVGVKLRLRNGIIEDSEVVGLADAPTSKKMQADFIAHYKPMVVGKSIDEVVLTKVSGSSLTPKGFNDAVEKIKAQAKS